MGVLVQKIMTCVQSVTFIVKVNGQKSEVIRPRRGIRQKVTQSHPFYFSYVKSGYPITCPEAKMKTN